MGKRGIYRIGLDPPTVEKCSGQYDLWGRLKVEDAWRLVEERKVLRREKVWRKCPIRSTLESGKSISW